MKFLQTDWLTLINGDCIAAAPLVRALCPSVDAMVTDPAYRTISGGVSPEHFKGRTGGMLEKNDGKIFDHNDVDLNEWLPVMFDLLKDPSHAYVMSNFMNLENMFDALRSAGFNIHNLLTWIKNSGTPNRWYMKNVEYTFFARKGAAFAINNMGSMTAHNFNMVRNRHHPTEKPVELMEQYILNSTQPGDTVIDPFAGSGATGVACMNTGRKFIGIEIDPKYYDIMCLRLSGAL